MNSFRHAVRERRELACVGASKTQPRSGLISFSPGNREKSRSLEASVAPCSRASAARWASMTNGPLVCPDSISFWKMAQCFSPGVSSTVCGRSSHSVTMLVASLVERGAANARWLVLMRRKAVIVCHAKQNRLAPDNCVSSHCRDVSLCCVYVVGIQEQVRLCEDHLCSAVSRCSSSSPTLS
jgi:hypothetical protein